MSKVTSLLPYFPVLFLILFYGIWIGVFSTAAIELEDEILERQINYATDSALGEMLYESNAPYNNDDPYSNVELDAAWGMEDFCRMMCYNFGLDPVDSNMQLIRTRYIKGAALAEWDGVYGWIQAKYETSGHDLVLVPKVPYYTEWTDSLTGETWQYCLTLGHKYCYRAGYTGGNYQLLPLGSVGPTMTDDVQNTFITKKLSDVLTKCIYESLVIGDDRSTVQIPASVKAGTDRGIQGVRTPTFIVYMEGERASMFSRERALALGGSSLTLNQEYIGYTTTDGHKYFATPKQWQQIGIPAGAILSGNWYSPYEAALAGYVDLTWMED